MPYCRIDDGTEIYYQEYGSGDRHLICSQIDHDYTVFSFEREMSRRGFHVYLLTDRGFGKSTHTDENYGLGWYDRFADDVIAFADKMGIDKFVYSGASHGSGVGWHLCLRNPERLICFFADVAGPLSPEGVPIEGILSGNDVTAEKDPNAPAFCSLPDFFYIPNDDPAINERRRLCREADSRLRTSENYEEIYESPQTMRINTGPALIGLRTEEKLREALRTIKTPVLMLGGTEDVISTPELMIRTAKCLPNCKLVIHSGFGHVLDIFEELADDAVSFYENVVNTGRYYKPVDNTPIEGVL